MFFFSIFEIKDFHDLSVCVCVGVRGEKECVCESERKKQKIIRQKGRRES
jgi:hypothetical protein